MGNNVTEVKCKESVKFLDYFYLYFVIKFCLVRIEHCKDVAMYYIVQRCTKLTLSYRKNLAGLSITLELYEAGNRKWL